MSWVRILVAVALVCQPASGSAFMASSPEAGIGDIHEDDVGTVAGAYTFDDYGALQSERLSSGGGDLLGTSLTYDGVGRIAREVTRLPGSDLDRSYTYTEDGELETVIEAGGPTTRYTYDANGNRASIDVNGTVTTASYDDQDRLTQYGNTTYAYDGLGQLATRTEGGRTWTFSYDVMGNLERVERDTGPPIEYRYDELGRRVSRSVGGTLDSIYVYRGGQIIAETNGAGQVTRRYVYGLRGHVPVAMEEGGVVYRLLTDVRGSVRAVAHASNGTIVQRLTYGPFGETIEDTRPGRQPFAYAGGLYDHETGLTRFGARDYDPKIGRWLAKDPIGFAGGDASLYSYVGQDPINFIDPDGEVAVIIPAIAAFIAPILSGAAISAAIDLASQLAANGGNIGCIDWGGVGRSALIGGAFGALGKIVQFAFAARGVAPQIGSKLEYFLGRATGNAHNVERSTQMLRQLERVGLPDSPATRQYLAEHLTRVLRDPSNIARVQENGRIVRESVLMGPRGGLKFETVWEGARLITGNLYGGL
jgi:RHS repeat-associated protein